MILFSSQAFVVCIVTCFITGYTKNIFFSIKSTRSKDLLANFFLKSIRYGKLGNKRFGKEIPEGPILTPINSARQPCILYPKKRASNVCVISSEEDTIMNNIAHKIIIHPPHAIHERAYNSPLFLSNRPASRFQVCIFIRSQTDISWRTTELSLTAIPN